MIKDIELGRIAHKFFNDNLDTAGIWNKKYSTNGESPGDVWKEMSRLLASIEDESVKKEWEIKFNNILSDWKFVPAGRILFGLRENIRDKNKRKITLSNCYVLPSPEDNLESIFDIGSKMARVYSSGGGVGIDLSLIRPKGSKVNNSAVVSDGIVPFMSLYSEITNTIAISGRRGALMLTLDVEKNPDILEFINAKKDLNKVNYANISIKLSDNFMNAVLNDEEWNIKFKVKDSGEVINRYYQASYIFDKIIKNNWESAEPGIIFWDKMKNYTPTSQFEDFKPISTNPCLHPDTMVKIKIDGEVKDISIEELSKLDEKKIEIYSYNIENDNFEWDLMNKCWLTRKNAELLEIELENGNILKLTPDHKIYTKNRGWVEAQFLTESDDLIVNES